MLVIAASISASVGFGFFLRSAAAAMIMPDWQKPHCGTATAGALQCSGGIVVFVLGNVRKCDVFRYWTAVTTSEPTFVRAWRSGRYMSSTDAAGCTKRPGVTARTM